MPPQSFQKPRGKEPRVLRKLQFGATPRYLRSTQQQCNSCWLRVVAQQGFFALIRNRDRREARNRLLRQRLWMKSCGRGWQNSFQAR